MADRRILRGWLYSLDRFELIFRPQIGRARNEFIARAANVYGITHQVPNFVLAGHRIRLESLLESHYRDVIPYFGEMALSQIRRRQQKSQTHYEGLISEWMSREALRKATLIADTDKQDVLDAISKGLDEGDGTEAI